MKEIMAAKSLTMYGLLKDNALRFPERPAIEFMDCMTSYRELLEKVDTAAGAFIQAGICQGGRVAICLPNSPQMVIAFYALNRIGAVAVMINPLISSMELSRYIDETESKSILVLDIFLKKFTDVFMSSEKLESIVCCSILSETSVWNSLKLTFVAFPKLLFSLIAYAGMRASANKSKKIFKWKEFINGLIKPVELILPSEAAVKPEEDAVIFFSGGTSSRPKAVVHSSISINTSSIQALLTEPPIEEGMSMLALLPGFHAFGLTVSIHTAFACGGRCILVPRFNSDAVARLFIERKPTYTAGVPTIYEGILRSRLLKKAQKNGTLDMKGFRLAFCGGDKLPEELRQRFGKLILESSGRGIIAEGYGLTECCPVTVMPRIGWRESSLGRPFPGIELTIVRPGTIEELSVCEEGEICIHSLSVMSRYLNGPEETSKALKVHEDGRLWLHTGDIGRLDEDGFLYYSYRLNHMLKVSGYSVYPAYVESILETHPLVQSACLVGISDSHSMCRLKAYVILKKRYPENRARHEILAFCTQRLMPWAIPYDIEFRRDLPRTQLGKIAWGQLKGENRQIPG